MTKRFSLLGSLAAAAAGVALAMAPTLVKAAPVPTPSDAALFRGSAAITSGTGCSGEPAVCLVGGSGGFAFTSSLCEYVSDPDLGESPPETSPELPGACTINSTGTFSNIVCGTGTADGGASATTITATSGGDAGEGATTVTDYHILFVGSVGVLTGHATEADSTPGGGTVAGVVQLSAVPDVPSVGGPCTNGFTITSLAVIFDVANAT